MGEHGDIYSLCGGVHRGEHVVQHPFQIRGRIERLRGVMAICVWEPRGVYGTDCFNHRAPTGESEYYIFAMLWRRLCGSATGLVASLSAAVEWCAMGGNYFGRHWNSAASGEGLTCLSPPVQVIRTDEPSLVPTIGSHRARFFFHGFDRR
jgi:hypothetical protein